MPSSQTMTRQQKKNSYARGLVRTIKIVVIM